jgi:hypothetical protein
MARASSPGSKRYSRTVQEKGDGGAGGGFAAVGDEGYGCSEECGQELVLGRKLGVAW